MEHKFTKDNSPTNLYCDNFLHKKGYKLFIHFLIKNNCYDRYLRNVLEQRTRLDSPSTIDRFIDIFTWMHTEEGHGYWSGINYKWIKYIDENIYNRLGKKHT